ncbi:cell division protein FtsQ/DivIB [Alphaproteobacteria bacterium LSUCC0684]
MRLNLYRSSDASPRRPSRKPPLGKILLSMMAVSLALAGLAAWLWREVIGDRVLEATAHAGLRLERVEINGRLNVSEKAVKDMIERDWHTPMIRLDLERIHDDLLRLGWVKGARVERRLPSTLIITLEERQALALYQDEAGHHVIDRDGEVIAGVAVEEFTHLPVIKGPNAPAKAASILALLKAEPDLFAEVWSLSFQSERRWDVFLRNNIRIQLPEENVDKAWARLAQLDREHRLMQRDLMNIDLRVPNKLVIRPSRSAQKGSNT